MKTIETTDLSIKDIPATLWGKKAEKVFIAVHDNITDRKDVIISGLAEVVCPMGWQVLSFDRPQRIKNPPSPCGLKEQVSDLQKIIRYAKATWSEISLLACGMGAYLCLLACKNIRLRQCLMVSPVTDMATMLSKMLADINITPERLRMEKSVTTPFGQILSWQYYEYVIKHPVKKWPFPTRILCGGRDEICDVAMIKEFAARSKADMTILANSWHYIHTPAEMSVYRRWLSESLNKNKGKTMKNLFTVDMKNYDKSWPRKERTAIRAIIIKNGKIALIKSQKYGEYKFPGGGMKKNESEYDTLKREVLEETGMIINPDNIKEFGETIEIRRNFEEEETLYQVSKYYLCQTTDEKRPRHLDDYEADYGYEPEWVSIDYAVKNNNAVINYDNIPWKKRDTAVLELLAKKRKKNQRAKTESLQSG